MTEVRLIDAIELVRYMCGACPSCQNGECIDKMCWKYEDRARIENAPTIEPEVRHGRWNYRHEDDWCYCTACGTDAEGSYGECLETYYCPNCGARMDGGADNGNKV